MSRNLIPLALLFLFPIYMYLAAFLGKQATQLIWKYSKVGSRFRKQLAFIITKMEAEKTLIPFYWVFGTLILYVMCYIGYMILN